jgi:hypothetical protein
MSVVRIARPVTGTPLARRYERRALLATKKRGAIPWERFRRERYPAPALALAYDAASRLATGEYSAVELFARITAGLVIVGAPLDLIGASAEVPGDELRHADLALRFAALCKGEASLAVDYETSPHARAWSSAPTLEQIDGLVLEIAAVGETLACALLGACAERATDPVARALYASLVADEIHHARLGWYYLAWRSPQWSRAERQRVADLAGRAVVDVEQRFGRGRDAPRGGRAGARALGVLDTKGQRAVVRAVMVDEIVPALDALGLGASHAWRRRKRVA